MELVTISFPDCDNLMPLGKVSSRIHAFDIQDSCTLWRPTSCHTYNRCCMPIPEIFRSVKACSPNVFRLALSALSVARPAPMHVWVRTTLRTSSVASGLTSIAPMCAPQQEVCFPASRPPIGHCCERRLRGVDWPVRSAATNAAGTRAAWSIAVSARNAAVRAATRAAVSFPRLAAWRPCEDPALRTPVRIQKSSRIRVAQVTSR